MENFENTEPDRPEFYGTKQRQDPVVPDELQWIYPVYLKVAKYALSVLVLLFMVSRRAVWFSAAQPGESTRCLI